jgi:hypothetical protein
LGLSPRFCERWLVLCSSPQQTFEKPHDFSDPVNYDFRTMRSIKSALSTEETLV